MLGSFRSNVAMDIAVMFGIAGPSCGLDAPPGGAMAS